MQSLSCNDCHRENRLLRTNDHDSAQRRTSAATPPFAVDVAVIHIIPRRLYAYRKCVNLQIVNLIVHIWKQSKSMSNSRPRSYRKTIGSISVCEWSWCVSKCCSRGLTIKVWSSSVGLSQRPLYSRRLPLGLDTLRNGIRSCITEIVRLMSDMVFQQGIRS